MPSDPSQPGIAPYGGPSADRTAAETNRPQSLKPRTNAVAAIIAGTFAVLIVCTTVWFSFYNVIVVNTAGGGGGPAVSVVNVIFGAVAAGVLLVAAGFTFARRIPGAWTLCVLSALYVVGMFLGAPLMWGTPLSQQIQWIFSFDDTDSAANALGTVFAIVTATSAAIAGGLKSYGSTPSR